MTMKIRFCYILIFLFSTTDVLAQLGVQFTPEMLFKELKKIEGHDSCKMLENKILSDIATINRSNEKYFVVKNGKRTKYLFIGRVNTCRAGGCSSPNTNSLQTYYEFFDYFILYDSAARVVSVRVYNYEATHGHEIMLKGWLKQFENYDGSYELKAGKHISSITGATISVSNIVEDVKMRTRFLRENLQQNKYKVYEGFAQGTTFRILYVATNKTDIKPGIDSILQRVDDVFSRYKNESLLSKLNANETNMVNDSLFNVLFLKAQRIEKLSGGAFDIRATYHSVGCDFAVENGILIKSDASGKLDFDGIAQGYTVDLISEWLHSKHLENFLVEIGGEIRCAGLDEKGDTWLIGIDNPVTNSGSNYQMLDGFQLRVSGKSVSTSGNYRHKGHILDPLNGLGAENEIMSVTVVADECAEADAVATVLCIKGLNESISFLKNNKQLQAIIIYTDADGEIKIYKTPGIEIYLSKDLVPTK